MATELEEDFEEDEEDFDFREIVEESVRESLIGEIEDVWGEMHHNARINNWPDFENDYEEELFWNVLSEYAHDEIKMVQDEIYEKFYMTWNLYQYGRMGATIAPNEIMARACCGGFGGLSDVVYEYEVGTLDDVLAALRYIDKSVKDFCANIEEWWKDAKECNEWEEEIAEHNEKT